jgi:hypothetical protein
MKMKRLLIPKSKFGKYSVFAILLFVVFFILGQSIVVAKGPFESPSFFNDPIPAILMIIAGLSGVLAFLFGLFALVKARERAIPVFISTLVGLFILIFWLGEVLSPH